MKKRRSFLAAVASGAVGLSLGARDPSAAQSTPPPAPAASGKTPSAAALAAARAMRTFDPALTDSEVAEIATGIDANRAAAAVLDPKKKRLANCDEPVLRFAAFAVPE
jgi:ABC-type transport system substrate-binding protein